MKILKEDLDGSKLTVLVEVPLRKTLSEKVKIVNSKDVINKLEEKYQITSTVKGNTLSNSMRGDGKQKGIWIFMIKEEQKKRTRTRKPRAPAAKKKVEPIVKEEEATEPTKSSTKRSIRGRMSKIAKEINSKKE